MYDFMLLTYPMPRATLPQQAPYPLHHMGAVLDWRRHDWRNRQTKCAGQTVFAVVRWRLFSGLLSRMPFSRHSLILPFRIQHITRVMDETVHPASPSFISRVFGTLKSAFVTSLILGLVATNVATLLNDSIHTGGYKLLEGLLGSVVDRLDDVTLRKGLDKLLSKS